MSEGQRGYEKRLIRPEMTVRQIASDFPAARDVFRRHGEGERSGRFGYFEPLIHFASRRNVRLPLLLEELRQATGVPVVPSDDRARRIHREFLITALAITLLLGAMPASAVFEWLALLLFAISAASVMWHRDPLLRTGRVTKASSLAVLLAEHPWIEDEAIASGSVYLSRARRVPAELTIGSFAESEGWSPDEFVAQANALLPQKTALGILTESGSRKEPSTPRAD